ncbi:hypothetical protein EW026_g2774 [Hermanssonia centrifuga]|uniref:Uncharacterized protein n=1 Tax=Hermanssonia centrifuga TaxID=98765 RepID=A0A4S4KN73_9APHY|nr:hypothetical protein EW026_g2774 [Hermanssonia centrifuga]
MEALLSKYPDQIPWLERHGFSVQDLIESLKWYPAQQLGEMESAPPEEREGRYATLEEVSEENFDRLEANLVKVLPIQQELIPDMSEFASCRILVISSTTDQAQQFVQRVKALRSDSIDFESTGQQTPVLTNTSDNGSICIPWTIVNKYYTADVHFEIRELQSFSGDHASEVPAIIYVWSCGEPYQDYVSTLSQKLQHHDPEVSLAVRLGGASSVPAEGKDAEDGLDEFLSSHGLEYVDGDRDGAGYLDEDRSGVPGLPRVIDALSTIMWPSLVQSAATSARKSRARELLDWARVEEADDGLRALISSNDDKEHEVGSSGADAAPKKSRMQREMDELEKWLEEDDIGRRRMDDAQAWIARDDATDGWSDIPTPMIRTPGGDQTSLALTTTSQNLLVHQWT